MVSLSEVGLFSGQGFLFLALSSVCHDNGLAEVGLGLKVSNRRTGMDGIGVVFLTGFA